MSDVSKIGRYISDVGSNRYQWRKCFIHCSLTMGTLKETVIIVAFVGDFEVDKMDWSDFYRQGSWRSQIKDPIFLLVGDKRNCAGSISVGKIVTALFRALANWQLHGCRGSGAEMELLSLNSLEFVSPEHQLWCQSFGLQRMDRLSL